MKEEDIIENSSNIIFNNKDEKAEKNIIEYSSNIKFIDENTEDLFTVINSESTLKSIEIDETLASNFKDIIKKMRNEVGGILGTYNSNVVSLPNGLSDYEEYKKYKFYLKIINRFNNYFSNLYKNLNQIYLDVKLIKINLNKCIENLKFLKKKSLNTKMKGLEKAEKNLKNVIEKENNDSVVQGDIQTYITMMKDKKKIVEAIKTRFSTQKEILQKSEEGLPSLLKKFESLNIISEEEYNLYKKDFIVEEKSIEDIFIKRGKKISLPPIDWASTFKRRIENITPTTFDPIKKLIGCLKEDKDFNESLEKQILLHFNLIQVFNPKSKLELKNIIKEDWEKKELLLFLNNNRLNSKEIRKKLYKEIVKIFESLEKIIVKDKDYKNADSLLNMSQTYYYIDETEKIQDNKKKFISKEMEKDDSFFDKGFQVEMLKYLCGSSNGVIKRHPGSLLAFYSFIYSELGIKADLIKEIINEIIKELNLGRKIDLNYIYEAGKLK